MKQCHGAPPSIVRCVEPPNAGRSAMKLLALCSLGLLAAACARSPQPGPCVWLLVDQSISLSERQQARLSETGAKLLDRMRPGCRLTILGVHDRADCELLYQAETTPITEESVFDELVEGQRQIRLLRAQALGAIRGAIGARARWTRLFDTLDRVQPCPGRATVIVFLSDMVHSDPAVDLGKLLTPENARVLAAQVASRYGWRADRLAGTRVVCLLPGGVPGERQHGPEFKTLRSFWEALFDAIGARVVHFENYLPEGAELAGV